MGYGRGVKVWVWLCVLHCDVLSSSWVLLDSLMCFSVLGVESFVVLGRTWWSPVVCRKVGGAVLFDVV